MARSSETSPPRARRATTRPAPKARRVATRAKPEVPKIGIVSLGCPKALVDSERIVTRLRAEG